MLPPPHPKIPRYHHHHYDHHCVVFSHQEVERPLAFPNNPTAGLASMPPATASSLDEEVFFPAEMYHYQQQHHQETLEAVLRQQVTAAPAAIPEPGNGSGRKRPFRTDRHSKIRTAQGVRDRRMRLSVGVARDFFALQDLLGFDKASNTVDWLLTQSKPAIDRLSHSDSTPQPGAPPPPAAAITVKEKGEAAAATASSSTSTGCFRDERATETMESIGGGDGGEPDWFASGTPAMEQLPMEGLDYYYQYYQLEEMMRAATTEDQ